MFEPFEGFRLGPGLEPLAGEDFIVAGADVGAGRGRPVHVIHKPIDVWVVCGLQGTGGAASRIPSESLVVEGGFGNDDDPARRVARQAVGHQEAEPDEEARREEREEPRPGRPAESTPRQAALLVGREACEQRPEFGQRTGVVSSGLERNEVRPGKPGEVLARVAAPGPRLCLHEVTDEVPIVKRPCRRQSLPGGQGGEQ